MCFAARSIRDENYKHEKEKDEEIKREKKRQKKAECAAWMHRVRFPKD